MSQCQVKKRGCRPETRGARSLKEIIQMYRAYRKEHPDDLVYYAGLRSFHEALEAAAMAQRDGGKRCDHQRRLKRGDLLAARAKLRAAEAKLRTCKSFARLHELVCQLVGDLPGIGELYCYDTAARLGAQRGIRPEAVYVHAGTREGVKALEMDGKRQMIALAGFPAEFRVLEPEELEDVLCMYKEQIRRIWGGRNRS